MPRVKVTPRKMSPKLGQPTLRIISVSSDPDVAAWERGYLGDLHLLIDEIFERAYADQEWTWSQLARVANLGYQTVCNLGERRTKYPRFSTVYKLAQAVGWNVQVRHQKFNKSRTAYRFKVG